MKNEQKDEELKENKEMIAYMTKKDFSRRKKKKNKDKRNTDIQTQCTEINQKMDLLVKTMEQINIREIEYHAQGIDKLCAKRDMRMKKTTERYHKKTKETRKEIRRETTNCICGTYIAKE